HCSLLADLVLAPISEVGLSSSGVSAETVTCCETWPTSSVKSTVTVWISTSTLSAIAVLKPVRGRKLGLSGKQSPGFLTRSGRRRVRRNRTLILRKEANNSPRPSLDRQRVSGNIHTIGR